MLEYIADKEKIEVSDSDIEKEIERLSELYQMTKDELISALEEFYPKEKQSQTGVLGIRIELI